MPIQKKAVGHSERVHNGLFGVSSDSMSHDADRESRSSLGRHYRQRRRVTAGLYPFAIRGLTGSWTVTSSHCLDSKRFEFELSKAAVATCITASTTNLNSAITHLVTASCPSVQHYFFCHNHSQLYHLFVLKSFNNNNNNNNFHLHFGTFSTAQSKFLLCHSKPKCVFCQTPARQTEKL